MDTETATNPVDGAQDFESFEATVAAETQEVETTEAAEPETFAEEGAEVEQQPAAEPETFEVKGTDGKTYQVPASDWIEVQVNGQTVAIPKAAEAGVMKDADYTQRTQTLKERETALEAIQQATDAELSAAFTARSLGLQLQQMGNINWAQEINRAQWEYDQGGDDRRSAVAAAKAGYDQLKDAFQQAAAQHQGLRQQRESESQREAAKAIDEGRAAVSKIPGWTEQSHAELKAIATSPEIGFTADEIGDEISINPKVARAMMLVKEALENRRKAKQTQNLSASQTIKPIPAVKGSAGATPVRADTNDFKAFEKLAQRQLAKG